MTIKLKTFALLECFYMCTLLVRTHRKCSRINEKNEQDYKKKWFEIKLYIYYFIQKFIKNS